MASVDGCPSVRSDDSFESPSVDVIDAIEDGSIVINADLVVNVDSVADEVGWTCKLVKISPLDAEIFDVDCWVGVSVADESVADRDSEKPSETEPERLVTESDPEGFPDTGVVASGERDVCCDTLE